MDSAVIKTGKWTDEEAQKAVAIYEENGKTPEALETVAEALGRSKRSVQGKLTSLQVYVVPEKPKARKKEEGPTKGEILTAISNKGFDIDGFENATKPALQRLEAFVASKVSAD